MTSPSVPTPASSPARPAREGIAHPLGRPRRGDVEGLRAIAVLAVVAFHGAVPWATGGFVGVDIFFVISGFLITGLMLKDVAEHGRVRLKEFYARRARRILPLAGVVLTATLLATLLIRPPLATLRVTGDAVATALYASNWWFLHEQTDYLASTQAPSPLLHFWSLSVEEQFYLVWPVLLLGVALAFAGRGRRARRRRAAVLAAVVGVVGLASFALSLWWTAVAEPRAYLATPTRVWQFMAGAALAVAAPLIVRAVRELDHRSPRTLRVTRWGVGAAGLGALLWAVTMFDATTPYPGTAALVPTLGTVAVILAGSLLPYGGRHDGEADGVSRALATRPMRFLGRTSYAWYLWHWPVVVLVPLALGGGRGPVDLPWQALLALSVGALAPAYLSMRLVEDPVRFARALVPAPRGLAVGAAFMTVPLVASLAIAGSARAGLAEHVTDLPRDEAMAVMSTPVDRGASPENDPQARPAAADATAGATVPAPAAAAADAPDRSCLLTPAQVDGPPCLFGEIGSSHRIVLFGDSHAQQWETPLAQLAAGAGYELRVRTKASCAPSDYPVESLTLGRDYTECYTFRARVLDEIRALRPEIVVVASYNFATNPAWVRGWDPVLREIAATGARVVYVRPTPLPGFDVPSCISGSFDAWSTCALDRDRLGEDPVGDRIAAGDLPGVTRLDLTPYLCGDAGCPAVRGHVMIYRDPSHVSDTAARGLRPVIARTLEPLLVG